MQNDILPGYLLFLVPPHLLVKFQDIIYKKQTMTLQVNVEHNDSIHFLFH